MHKCNGSQKIYKQLTTEELQIVKNKLQGQRMTRNTWWRPGGPSRSIREWRKWCGRTDRIFLERARGWALSWLPGV